MVVCFSVGKNSKSVISNLKSVLDNVEFYTYDSVQELVKEATLRHIDFKRLILSNVIINDVKDDLDALNSFIRNYSSNTEVVFILNPKLDNCEEVKCEFNKVFNSPMYSVVKPDKITPRTLMEIITSDMVEVQVKYSPKEDSKAVESKNSTKSSEVISSKTSSYQSTLSSGKVDTNKSILNDGEEPVFQPPYYMETAVNSNINLNEGSINSDSNQTELGSLGVEEFTSKKIEEDYDDLSLGEFGSNHSDTGFLDEDEKFSDTGLQEFINQQKQTESEKERIVEKPKKFDNIQQKQVVHERNKLNIIKSQSNVDILLSLRELESTQEIVNEAVRIVEEDHASVLLIDLDYRDNRLLSFIDVEKFYQRGYYNGISNNKIYVEDGVGVVSNGYGFGINPKELLSFMSSSVIKSYEVIFMDCPTDCVGVLPVDLLKNFNIILKPGVNITHYVSTSRQLTSRDYLSLEKERIIMEKCLLDMEGSSQQDIEFLKGISLFANGSWLDRIGL